MRFVWARYLAIIAVGVVSVTAVAHSFAFAVWLLASEVNRYIVPLMVDGNRRKWGVLAWCGCLVSLTGMCYLVDTLLFPHTAREIVRARDAALASLLGMVGGYFVNWSLDPSRRGKSRAPKIAETNL